MLSTRSIVLSGRTPRTFYYVLDFRLRKNQANYREAAANQAEKHLRSLPSLVMDFAFPAHAILCESDIKHLRLVEHFMVET